MRASPPPRGFLRAQRYGGPGRQEPQESLAVGEVLRLPGLGVEAADESAFVAEDPAEREGLTLAGADRACRPGSAREDRDGGGAKDAAHDLAPWSVLPLLPSGSGRRLAVHAAGAVVLCC